MEDTSSQDKVVAAVMKAFKLSGDECKWKDRAIVIEPEKGKDKLVIEVSISSTLKRYNTKRFKFINCVFKKQINLKQITFKEILYFLHSTFEREVEFSRSLFEKRVFFSESTFEQNASFEEVFFDHNVYFDKTIFKNEVTFDESEFCRHAHFYGTRFNTFPNFTQTIFNGNINLTNAEPHVRISNLKEKIEGIYTKRKEKYDENQDKNPEKNLQKHEIANELRDSFRAIKSALIRDNNMLDAHDYEVLEQYCKEIESEYKNSNQ